MVGTTTLTLLSLMFSLPISFVRIVLESTNSNAKIGKLDMLQDLVVLEQAHISLNLSFIELQNSKFDHKSSSNFICSTRFRFEFDGKFIKFWPKYFSFYKFALL